MALPAFELVVSVHTMTAKELPAIVGKVRNGRNTIRKIAQYSQEADVGEKLP
jgi:hypothetical protein